MVWLNSYVLIPLISSEEINCFHKTWYEYHAIGVYLVSKTTHQIACSEISDALTHSMVTPREIVTAARARRKEISAMLYAEKVSQLSFSTAERNQMDFMFVKQEQCSVFVYCASAQLHYRPANIHSEPPRSVSIILQETTACCEILYIWSTLLVTSRRLANRIKPSPVTVPTCRNMHYRRQRNCWSNIREKWLTGHTTRS